MIPTTFAVERTRHEYRVVKMWEEDPTIFLQSEALLPLAPLAATDSPSQLLKQTAQQISRVQLGQKRQEISAYTQILSGLRFSSSEIYRALREDTMQESVVYQDILRKGTQAGIQQGIQQEARLLIQRLLTRRVGDISEQVQSAVDGLSLASQVSRSAIDSKSNNASPNNSS